MLKHLNSAVFFQGHVVFDAQGSRMAWTLIEQLQGMLKDMFLLENGNYFDNQLIIYSILVLSIKLSICIVYCIHI